MKCIHCQKEIVSGERFRLDVFMSTVCPPISNKTILCEKCAAENNLISNFTAGGIIPEQIKREGLCIQ